MNNTYLKILCTNLLNRQEMLNHFSEFMAICGQYPKAAHSIRFMNRCDKRINDVFMDEHGHVSCVTSECMTTRRRVTNHFRVSEMPMLRDDTDDLLSGKDFYIMYFLDAVAVNIFFDTIINNQYDFVRGEANMITDSGVGNVYIQKLFTKDMLCK